MNVLVVFEERILRELVSFYLEGRFNITVKLATSADEAIRILEGGEEAFDALVCDYRKSSTNLIPKVIADRIDLHMLCLSNAVHEDPMLAPRREWIHFISVAKLIESLEATLKRLFKELQMLAQAGDLDFCKIKPPLLLLANPLKGAIYVKLSDSKFIRVFQENLDFDQTDLEYFVKKKGFDTLFIKRKLSHDFSLQIQSNLWNRSKKAAVDPSVEAQKRELKEKLRAQSESEAEVVEVKVEQSAEEKKMAAERAALIQQQAKAILNKKAETTRQTSEKEAEEKRKQELQRLQAEAVKTVEKTLGDELQSVHKLGNQLGFTKEIQELTRQSVFQTIHAVRKAPALSALLLQLSKNKEKYISSHSMLLAYLSCAIASQLEWSSDSTYQKLTLAAFLHDITLKNNELAAIQTLDELTKRQAEFSPEEIKAFREHPAIGAQIAQRFSEVPPDVDAIIAQHHERPDGKGFPRGLTHMRIGPLSSVFIVAHDLVSFLIKQDSSLTSSTKGSIDQFVQKAFNQYQFGNFKKVIAAVRKIKA